MQRCTIFREDDTSALDGFHVDPLTTTTTTTTLTLFRHYGEKAFAAFLGPLSWLNWNLDMLVYVEEDLKTGESK